MATHIPALQKEHCVFRWNVEQRTQIRFSVVANFGHNFASMAHLHQAAAVTFKIDLKTIAKHTQKKSKKKKRQHR